MNQVNTTEKQYTDEELLSGKLYNQLPEKDKKLLSSVINPSKYMSPELLPAFYSYILAYKVPNETELFLKMPEELMQHIDLDYSDLALDFQDEFGENKELTILQVGCGRADLLVRLAKLGYCNLYGIECNPLQFQGAQKKIDEAGVTGKVNMIQAFVQEYDYSQIGKPVDVVIIHNFWGVIDPPSTQKMMEGLNKCMSTNARIYLGPLRLNKDNKKQSMLKQVWKGIRLQRRITKVKNKFGIQILFSIPFAFDKYGFTKNTLFFKNANYNYIRQSR